MDFSEYHDASTKIGKLYSSPDELYEVDDLVESVEQDPGTPPDSLFNEAASLLDAIPSPRPNSPALFVPMASNNPTTPDDNDNDAYMSDVSLSSASPAPTPSPSAPHPSIDNLKHARDLKSRINTSLRILAPKSSRNRTRNVIDDPDNHAIKHMRQDQNMGWDAIAIHLNAERLEHGEPQTWTAAAVYSRFVRNAPRIAAAHGEVGFNPKDYMYLRHPATHPAAQLAGALNDPSGYSFGAGGGRKRVRDSEHAEKDLADNVRHKCADTLSEQARMLEESCMTEEMMEAVAEVGGRFWGHVATEMEKRTGKFFDPKVLESRYHAV